MKGILLIISISIFNLHLLAQESVDQVLAEIEKNNSTLEAWRKSVEAEKIGNRTDIYLQNPEANFNYLWGNPSAIGNRNDFSILQTFDFPTAYGYKSQIAEIKNEQSAFDYQRHWMDIRFQTQTVCFDLIYTNALLAELSKRLGHAQSIEKSFRLKLEKGDANILDYNKSKLNLLNVTREMESLNIGRDELLSQLKSLNGGKTVDFNLMEFPIPDLPVDFEQWFVLAEQKNPTLCWLKKEMELSQKQTKLSQAMSLPKLNAGYMSESVVGEQFQGVSVGLSIPVWENRNKVKYAKAKALAIESKVADGSLQFHNHLKALHTKTVALQKQVNEYRASLKALDNSELAKKALDFGEISLINYMAEFSLYYESINKLLELEREMNKLNAQLIQYQ